jgi:hypothetical protein
MTQLPTDLKEKVVAALLEKRKLFSGTDQQFSKQYGIHFSIFSRLKNGGSLEDVLRNAQWLNIARELGVETTERRWLMARTDVFVMIEEDVLFCKSNAKSMMLVDDCGIGKSYSAKHLSRSLSNCFYIDGRQCPTKSEFVRELAKAIGVESEGRLATVRANIKYALKALPFPVVIIDEAGAFNYEAFMLLIELWNATEKACGWYIMGADGLRKLVETGITNKKVGYAEFFSRFNERYNSVVPKEKDDKLNFYRKLITDVLTVNMPDKSSLKKIVNQCLANDSGRISGLRRAETLLILNTETVNVA